ncbi:MAG: ArsA family ATPase [Deltaproteobacteria bacterium]|nr:MAG: ArsA family ATPase [Deltaproteobacteria bacterium]
MSTLARIFERRIVVCVGSGGVGKTTVAASIGVRAARMGLKALVVTIDPARRLANSLGLESLGNVETRIGDDRFRRAGLEVKGELWAMMLDVKRTSDELISRSAPSREQAEKIFRNRFYQTFSTVLAGSQEYMAMEKLAELHERGGFDLVILDTPPTAHALDFLEAPNKLIDVFGNDSLRWLATPALAAGKIGMRALGFGSGYLVRQLSKFTGIETLQALAEFLLSMRGMYDTFKERASTVKALLTSDETRFVLVTAPAALPMDEARYFLSVLRQYEIPVGAVVVNRIHPDWDAAVGEEQLTAAALRRYFEPSLAERLALTLEEQRALAAADRRQVMALRSWLEEAIPIRCAPSFGADIHDLEGLDALGAYLFDGRGVVPPAALPPV